MRFGATLGLTTAAWAALATGCPSVGSYVCEVDDDCDRAGDGVCLDDGACAYPDADCPFSDLRRSPNAESQPSQCVDPVSIGACGWFKPLTIDTTQISASESFEGYPLLVSLTDSELRDIGAFAFRDSTGAHLPHEIERHDQVTGSILAWVRLPGWIPGEPLVLEIEYDVVQPALNDPTDVWDGNYAGVWHMNADLDGSDGILVRDSTPNNEDGIAYGNMQADQVIDGVIGEALRFDGDDDAIEVPASFLGQLEAFTISAWVADDSDGTIHGPFFSRFNGDNLYPRCRKIAESGGVLCQLGVADTEVTGISASSDLIPHGEVRHLAITYEPSMGRMELFVGGAFIEATEGTALAPDGGDRPVHFGRIDEFNTLLGRLDEIRLSHRVLPAAWIAADQRTQSAPADVILDLGPAQPRACPQ